MSAKKTLGLALAALVLAPAAMAQPKKDWKSWYGDVSVAYSSPEGAAGDAVDSGWNLSGGAIYRPTDWPVGLWTELGYNNFDIKGSILDQLGVNNGDVDIWSLTGGAIWSTQSSKPVNFYLEAGIGWYLIDVTVTNPGVGFVPPICGWWWCLPGGAVPVDVIVGSESTIRFGYDAGIGITFAVGDGSQIYLEAKYHWAQTTNETTEYVPIAIGFRW